MDYEKSRREEEARREAEERRRINPRIDPEGRRGEGTSFDDERYEAERSRPRGRSQSSGLSEAAGRVLDRGSGRGQRRGSAQGQMSGLYGSSIGSNILRLAVAELVGTFILVFTGTAVATAAILQRPMAGPIFYDSLAVALAFGLALAAIVATIGHIFGAHVNPAVTIGLAATNKFPWEYVPVYLGAQLLGGILGAIGTWITYGDAAREVAVIAATFPAENVGDRRAFLVELLITFILVFVVISVATKTGLRLARLLWPSASPWPAACSSPAP